MNCNEDFRTTFIRSDRFLNRCGCPNAHCNVCKHTKMTDHDCSCSRKVSPVTVRSESTCHVKTDCRCEPVETGCVDTYPVAMAYVPMQDWGELYDPMSGLHHGTVFRDLDLPWYKTNCNKECRR